jgi:hypothetical protein
MRPLFSSVLLPNSHRKKPTRPPSSAYRAENNDRHFNSKHLKLCAHIDISYFCISRVPWPLLNTLNPSYLKITFASSPSRLICGKLFLWRNGVAFITAPLAPLFMPTAREKGGIFDFGSQRPRQGLLRWRSSEVLGQTAVHTTLPDAHAQVMDSQ